MNLPRSIFRAYDIRGTTPDNLNEENIYVIGQAFGTYLLQTLGAVEAKIVVGYDSRPTSQSLSTSFIEGVASTGVNVVKTGLTLTPIIHYLTCVQDLGFDAGVMVTASHNPPHYNGLRLDFKNAKSFSSQDIVNLYDLCLSGEFVQGSGEITYENLNPLYIEKLNKEFSFNTDLKVVLDCGFGTSSAFVRDIFESVGLTPIYSDCTLNPSFPRGTPDPEKGGFMQSLQDQVLENVADLGIAFDQDADRFGVVTDKGQLVRNDLALLLLSKSILQVNAGAKIVYDVKCTSLLETFVREWGGVPVMVPTGHNNVQREVLKGAALGGEYSGHVYFNDAADRPFSYDDGIYAALRFISQVLDEKTTVSSLVAQFPVLSSTPELKLSCNDDEKFEVIAKIQDHIKSEKANFYAVSFVDGVRASVTPDSWFLVRASNTSPYLSLRVEATDDQTLTSVLQGVFMFLSVHPEIDLSGLESYLN